jgi:hypothetical protein
MRPLIAADLITLTILHHAHGILIAQAAFGGFGGFTFE